MATAVAETRVSAISALDFLTITQMQPVTQSLATDTVFRTLLSLLEVL